MGVCLRRDKTGDLFGVDFYNCCVFFLFPYFLFSVAETSSYNIHSLHSLSFYLDFHRSGLAGSSIKLCLFRVCASDGYLYHNMRNLEGNSAVFPNV